MNDRSTPAEMAITVTSHPLVEKAVTAARATLQRLYAPGRRTAKRRERVRDEAILRGVRASAALEGAEVPLEQARGAEVGDPIVQAALRVGPAYDWLVADWRAAPGQVLEQLHVLVAAVGEQVDPETLGRIRSDRDVADPFDIGPPPAPDIAAARLRDLEQLLSEERGDALVLAAVAHGELLALRPYGWGDGLIARAAQRLTLADRMVDPEFLTIPEESHLRLRTECSAALRAYTRGTLDGLAAWVSHCAAAIDLGADAAVALAEGLRR